MTARLEKAIRELPYDAMEQLADFAEFLAARTPQPDPNRRMKLDGAGMAADLYPEFGSGVEAAHAANDMWIAAVEKNLGT